MPEGPWARPHHSTLHEHPVTKLPLVDARRPQHVHAASSRHDEEACSAEDWALLLLAIHQSLGPEELPGCLH